MDQDVPNEILVEEQEEQKLYLGLLRAQNKIAKESIDLYNSFVDPLDAMRGDNGELWTALGDQAMATGPYLEYDGFFTEQQLTIARWQSIDLAKVNPFAICGHKNRINYIVGTGHTYAVTAKQNRTVPPETIQAVQTVIDDWCELVNWPLRQQENIRRYDRDGEVFIRFFTGFDGQVQIRHVAPVRVRQDANGDAPFGVLTEKDDVETILGYYIDGELVDAANVQHRKANVDFATRRGMPLFFPVRPALLRVDKLVRNMVATSDIQSAIALIRKHISGTSDSISRFRSNQTDATRTNGVTGQTEYVRRYGPGTILDAPAGMEYDFPAKGLDASNYVEVVKLVLRQICSRIVMPEFMLTSDPSEGNYASTMVAEGPAVKEFEEQQATQERFDLQVLKRVIQAAIDTGKLPAGILSDIHIHVGMPRLQVRDALKDAQVALLNMQMGILSPQTACAQAELDFHQEEENLAAYKKAHPDWTPPSTQPEKGADRGDKSSPDNGDAKSGNNQNSSKKVAKKLKQESMDALDLLEEMYP